MTFLSISNTEVRKLLNCALISEQWRHYFQVYACMEPLNKLCKKIRYITSANCIVYPEVLLTLSLTSNGKFDADQILYLLIHVLGNFAG